MKVKVKLPDGNWRYLELNRMGAALTSVFVDAVGGGRWARCYEYDTDGLLTRIFHPSAGAVPTYGLEGNTTELPIDNATSGTFTRDLLQVSPRILQEDLHAKPPQGAPGERQPQSITCHHQPGNPLEVGRVSRDDHVSVNETD